MATIKVGWISDSHLGYAQYGSAIREQDFFIGLQNALFVLHKTHKVDLLIHTGDLFHQSRLTSKMWDDFQKLNAWLISKKLTCWTLEGNHDQSDPPWIPGDIGNEDFGFRRLDSMIKDARTGLVLVGFKAQGVEELKSKLPIMGSCDLLLLHQLVREFIDFDLPGALSLDDMPTDKASLICLGDVHIRKFLPLPGNPKVEAGYPGSTELGSSAEDENKTAEIIEFDAVTRKYLKHYPVPFPTRPVIRRQVHKPEELIRTLLDVAGWRPEPKGARYPLLFLQHAPEIASVRENVGRMLDPTKWLVRISLLSAADEQGILSTTANSVERIKIQMVLDEAMATTDPIHPIMSALIDAELENVPERLTSYIAQRLA